MDIVKIGSRSPGSVSEINSTNKGLYELLNDLDVDHAVTVARSCIDGRERSI